MFRSRAVPRHRFLALCAAVLVGTVSLATPAELTRDGPIGNCGTTEVLRDSALRARFMRFEHSQSLAARKVCAIYTNNLELLATR